jgi:hypothetical protein
VKRPLASELCQSDEASERDPYIGRDAGIYYGAWDGHENIRMIVEGIPAEAGKPTSRSVNTLERALAICRNEWDGSVAPVCTRRVRSSAVQSSSIRSSDPAASPLAASRCQATGVRVSRKLNLWNVNMASNLSQPSVRRRHGLNSASSVMSTQWSTIGS